MYFLARRVLNLQFLPGPQAILVEGALPLLH